MTVIKILHQHTWIRGLTSASNSEVLGKAPFFSLWLLLLPNGANTFLLHVVRTVFVRSSVTVMKAREIFSYNTGLFLCFVKRRGKC